MKDEKNTPETKVLYELNKGIKMGMDSISNVIESVKDQTFKQAILSQYNGYNELLNRVDTKLQEFGALPKDIPPVQKAMGYIEVKVNTSADNSISHIAEMMLQGTNMGIIKGVKLQHEGNEMSEETQNILNDFVNYQEHCVTQLKEYL